MFITGSPTDPKVLLPTLESSTTSDKTRKGNINISLDSKTIKVHLIKPNLKEIFYEIYSYLPTVFFRIK